MTIGPVVLLGLLSIFFMLTTVRSSMMEEIEEGLKGTAAATLAADRKSTRLNSSHNRESRMPSSA